MHSFKLTELALPDGGRELRVEGELDMAVADQLEQALERLEGGPILIDLGPCEFIDSTGIAVVVRAHRREEEGGRQVAVHSPRGQVLRVLRLSGLTSNGLVFETREQALSGLSSLRLSGPGPGRRGSNR